MKAVLLIKNNLNEMDKNNRLPTAQLRYISSFIVGYHALARTPSRVRAARKVSKYRGEGEQG